MLGQSDFYFYDFDLDERGEHVGYYLDGNITYREIELITEIIIDTILKTTKEVK